MMENKLNQVAAETEYKTIDKKLVAMDGAFIKQRFNWA
jgi:hypothetical protein